MGRSDGSRILPRQQAVKTSYLKKTTGNILARLVCRAGLAIGAAPIHDSASTYASRRLLAFKVVVVYVYK